MDISNTLSPKSDQMDYEDVAGTERTFTIREVRKGPSTEQPVEIVLDGFPRPWRPAKTMRRLIVFAWGSDTSQYIGRQVRLFGDPTVKFGGSAVGGIRIRGLSHISEALTLPLMVSRGKRLPFVVQPLGKPAKKPDVSPVDAAVDHFETTFGVTRVELEGRLGRPSGEWTDADLDYLRALSKALTDGEKQIEDEFPEQPIAVDAVEEDSRVGVTGRGRDQGSRTGQDTGHRKTSPHGGTSDSTLIRQNADAAPGDGSEPSPDDPAWREHERQQETSR